MAIAQRLGSYTCLTCVGARSPRDRPQSGLLHLPHLRGSAVPARSPAERAPALASPVWERGPRAIAQRLGPYTSARPLSVDQPPAAQQLFDFYREQDQQWQGKTKHKLGKIQRLGLEDAVEKRKINHRKLQ